MHNRDSMFLLTYLRTTALDIDRASTLERLVPMLDKLLITPSLSFGFSPTTNSPCKDLLIIKLELLRLSLKFLIISIKRKLCALSVCYSTIWSTMKTALSTCLWLTRLTSLLSCKRNLGLTTRLRSSSINYGNTLKTTIKSSHPLKSGRNR